MAVLVQACLGLSMLAAASELLANLSERRLIDDFKQNRFSVSPGDFDRADDLIGWTALASVVCRLLVAIMLLIWLWRVYKNLEGPLRSRRLEYTPGWAVGWWFVPFANLVMPYKVVREAWLATDPRLPRGASPRERDGGAALVGWWWAVFIASLIQVRIGSSIRSKADELNQFHQAATWAIVEAGCSIVAAVLLMVVVRRITDRHEQRRAAAEDAEGTASTYGDLPG